MIHIDFFSIRYLSYDTYHISYDNYYHNSIHIIFLKEYIYNFVFFFQIIPYTKLDIELVSHRRTDPTTGLKKICT